LTVIESDLSALVSFRATHETKASSKKDKQLYARKKMCVLSLLIKEITSVLLFNYLLLNNFFIIIIIIIVVVVVPQFEITTVH